MNPATLGIMIPIIAIFMGCAIPMVAIWARHKQKVAEIQASSTVQHTAELAAQHATKNQEMEDRLRVLERIVTDKGYDVASQIEALRDTRQTDELLDHMPSKERI